MSKRVILGIVLSLAAGATPAFAQAQQPFRGLFGPAAETAPRESLDLSTSLFAVNDTNLPRLVARDSDGFSIEAGRPVHRPALGPLVHEARRADVVRRQWHVDRAVLPPTLERGAMERSRGGCRVEDHAEGAFRRRSAGAIQPLRALPRDSDSRLRIERLADVSAPDIALAVSGRESYRYNSGVNAGFQLSRRSMLATSYQHEYLDFVPVGQHDWRTHDASIALSHSVTQKTAFVAGYAYHVRDFHGERLPLRRQDINFGVNYNSTLPFSPRTTLTFMAGSTALSRSRATALSEHDSTFLRMIGRAELDHQLGQTWRVGLFYHRGVQYIEGLSDVFLADSVTGNLRGYLGPRVEVTSHDRLLDGPAAIRAAPARIRHECEHRARADGDHARVSRSG